MDWPWWVTTVSLGITKIVEEVIENEIEGRLKQAILDQVKQVIASVVDDLPASLRLFRIVTLQDRVDITVCPVGDHLPHVVLGTSTGPPRCSARSCKRRWPSRSDSCDRRERAGRTTSSR